MKKLLACLLSLLLLLGVCPSAYMAETPVVVDVSLDEAEGLEIGLKELFQEDEARAAFNQVLANMTLRVTAVEENSCLQLLLKDVPVAHVTVTTLGEQQVTTTSLLPGYALYQPVRKADEAALAQALQQDLTALLGTGTAGEYVLPQLSETPYDTHYTVDVPAGQVVERLLSRFAEAGMDVGDMPSAPDSRLQGDYYTRQDGGCALLLRVLTGADTANEIAWVREGEQFYFSLLPDQSLQDGASVLDHAMATLDNDQTPGCIATLEVLEDSVSAVGQLVAGEASVYTLYSHQWLKDVLYGTLTAEVTLDDSYLGAGLDYQWDGEQLQGNVLVRYPDTQELLRLGITGGATPGAAVETPDLAATTAIRMDDLSQVDEEALLAAAESGAVQAFILACSAMPDEMAVLANYLVRMENESLGIIGGADGPTAIFIATPDEEADETDAQSTTRPLFGAPAETEAPAATDVPDATARPLFNNNP